MKTAFYQGKSFDFPDDVSDEDIAKALPGIWEQVKSTMGNVIANAPETAFRQFAQKPVLNAKRLGKDLLGMDTEDDKAAIGEVDQRLQQLSEGLSLPQQAGLYGLSSALGSAPASVGGAFRALQAVRGGATTAEAARKGLGVATSIGAAPTGLNTYGESRDAGLSIPRSLLHASIDAAIEKYTEYFPGSKLIDQLDRPFWKSMATFMGRELTGEEIATVTQNLNAMVSSRPDMTLGDIAKDMVLTAGATIVAGGAQGAVMRGVGAILPESQPSAAVAPAAGGTPTPAPQTGPAPAPAPASAIDGLVRPTGATIPAAPVTAPVAPAAAAVEAEVAGQDAALRAAELGPMVKLYAPVLEGMTAGEVMALPNDQAGALQLLAQAGGKGKVLVAEIPQSQLEELKAAQKQNANLQKQMFFGHEVAVPVSMFLGPSAVAPTVGASPVSNPTAAAGGTSPLAGATAPSSSEVAQPDEPPQPLGVEEKKSKAKSLSSSIKIGKDKPKKVTFADLKTKAHFGLMAAIRKVASPAAAKLTDVERAKLEQRADAGLKAFMADMGETDSTMALRVLGQWYNETIDLVRANAEVSEVGIPALSQPAYERLKQEALGQRQKQQTKSVEVESKYKDDAHVQRMAKLVEKWIALFAPTMKVLIVGEGNITGTRARVSTDVQLFRLYVPNRALGNLVQIATLAHEFGHMLLMWTMNSPKYTEQLTKLKEDFAAAVSAADTMTAIDWVKKYAPADKIREVKKMLKGMGLSNDATAKEYADSLDAFHKENMVAKVGEERYRNWKSRHGSYALNFHEFAADQVSRYVTKRGPDMFAADMQGFFAATVATMKTFFEKVVSKLEIAPNFETWLRNLENADFLGKLQLDSEVKSGEYAESIGPRFSKNFDYTTKVLNMLPGKDRLKKVTVESAANRAEVTKNEREMILRTLDEFPGPTVDSQEFKTKVLEKLLPLKEVRVAKYATYGLDDYAFKQTLFEGTAVTDIWEWPFATPDLINVHFAEETQKYFAHTRTVRGADGAIHVLEVQSDWSLDAEQKQSLAEGQKILALIDAVETSKDPWVEKAFKAIHAYQKSFNPRQVPLTARQILQALRLSPAWEIYANSELTDTFDELKADLQTYIPRNNSEALMLNIYHYLSSKEKVERWAGEQLVENLSLIYNDDGSLNENYLMEKETVDMDIRNNLEPVQMAEAMEGRKKVSHLLPKTWWHLVVRETMKNARDYYVLTDYPEPEGQVVRFPSGLTAAIIEGQVAVYYRDGALYSYRSDPGLGRGVPVEGWETMPKRERMERMTQFLVDSNDPQELSDFLDILIEDNRVTEDGNAILWSKSWNGIYKFYEKELPTFLTKEYGGSWMTDRNGVKWFEVPVGETLDLKIEYFSFYAGVSDTLESLGSAGGTPQTRERFRGFLLNSLQINQLAKLYKNVPGLQRFRKAMQDMFAMKNRLLAAPNERMVEWYGLGRAVGRRMERLLMEEVESGQHLTKLKQVSTSNGSMIYVHESTPQLEARAAAHKLSPQAVKVYLGIKNDFASMLDVMERVLLESVNRYFASNPILAQIRRLEVKAEFDKFRAKPYFPDRGFGPWGVMVHAARDITIGERDFKQGELVYWRKFENERAQRKHFDKMRGSTPSTDFNVSASYVEDLPYVLRGLPANFTQIMVDELNLTPQQVEKLQQLRYDASREGAFLKLLEKGKKGVGGGSTDLRRVYADYFWRTSNFVSKMFFADEVNAGLADVHRQALEQRKNGGVSNNLDKLHERLMEKKEYVFNPQSEWEILRMWVSLWYLWAVPKSALMNISSVPTMGYGHLAAIFGDVKATKAMLVAIKDAAMTIRDPAGSKLTQEDHWALEQALLDGTTDQSFAAELAAVTDANALERLVPWGEWMQDSQIADSTRQVVWKSIWFGMMPFRAIEGVNRRTMLLAAFRLNREAGKSLEESYVNAKDAVDSTQNDYSSWNKPKFLEGKKSAALIFYSIVQHTAFFMYGGDRGWWRALMVLAVMGGMFALPGMENFIDIINWAWRKFSGEATDLRVEAHRAIKELGGNPELVLHGALHAHGFLGWDMSASVSMGRVIPGTDVVFGQGKFNDRFVQAVSEVGGPAGSLTMSALKAVMDDSNPSALQRWEKVMPTVARNVYRASVMWQQDEILDSQMRALIPDVTQAEIVGQALGFTPTRKAERQEILAAQRDAAEFYRLRRENLLSRLWLSKQAGDVDEETKALEAIDEYNTKVPDRKLTISRSNIRDSMKARQKGAKEVEDGIPREKKYRAVYEDIESALRKE